MVVSDAAAAVEFLRTVFGAVGDVHAGRPAEVHIGAPYGDRRAMVRDPFGNVFQIAHRGAERS
jgi:PhnB protein